MDLRQLRYFVTVVQEKHYSKAAKILHISQPSLSNAIKKLEDNVGFQLLERSTRGFALTDAGSVFYEKSLELVRKFDNMLKELDEMKQMGSGNISIGMIESAKFWLPKVVKKFKANSPKIHFQFKELLGKRKVFDSLIHYDVHFTITNQPIHKEEIILIPIYHEKLILVTHNEDPLNLLDVVTLPDLQGRDLIISTIGFQTREDILNAFEKEKINHHIRYEIERFETACSLVEQGLGITILPESYIKYNLNPNIATHTIESEYLERTVYLAYLKDRYLSPAVEELIEKVQSFFK
ncbi:LysR family transcriptional regulator [Bacillus sp. FJAT-29790]|uniref:LysR family transcriptional regulator n=1 Tax=Bacillus sp. FJAT-29790 TaxID=1895002 RepID=UPI001C24B217|nr:LysR family transcriptional regulator [Bacillus sp. FJAT-29790]MBU8878058.1 LysR family transcriptional regulator [Bacillus sp. FJAT-29790]